MYIKIKKTLLFLISIPLLSLFAAGVLRLSNLYLIDAYKTKKTIILATDVLNMVSHGSAVIVLVLVAMLFILEAEIKRLKLKSTDFPTEDAIDLFPLKEDNTAIKHEILRQKIQGNVTPLKRRASDP